MRWCPVALFFCSWWTVSNAWVAPGSSSSARVQQHEQKVAIVSIADPTPSDTPTMNRRNALLLSSCLLWFSSAPKPAVAYSGPTIDVNNAMAREFTAFPGLYPTIATKIVKGVKENGPYKSKKDVYAVLGSDLERDRLKLYDGAIKINKPDRALQQFKASQICKYECGGRTSSSYRDEQIKAVQAGRKGY